VLQDHNRNLVAGHLVVGLEPVEEGLGVLADAERRRLSWAAGNQAAIYDVQIDAGRFSGWLPP
jgi:hypothetical protein